MERVLDRWMVAETEVSILPIYPIKSQDRGWSSQHPITPDGLDMKILLGHVGERLWHIWEVPDFL